VTIRAIDHVNIRAPADDIARLKQFYCDVIGLSDGWRPEFPSRGHWLYAGTDPLVHLVEGDAAQDRGAQTGVDHVSFRSDDLDSFIERLRLRGVEFQLSRVPALGHRQLLTRDPLGIGVEITSAGPGQ
jgi:catechol 2,3-dioxygenase-like lactoylglutathione lyase family enzyme